MKVDFKVNGDKRRARRVQRNAARILRAETIKSGLCGQPMWEKIIAKFSAYRYTRLMVRVAYVRSV